ncbi:MAG: hypothetical protein QXT79_10000 [Thermofilaceae archaeon]
MRVVYTASRREGAYAVFQAYIPIPAAVAERWMGEGVAAVELKLLEDGRLLLAPLRGGEAEKALLESRSNVYAFVSELRRGRVELGGYTVYAFEGPHREVEAAEVYGAYRLWCEARGERPVRREAFYRVFQAAAAVAKLKRGSRVRFKGLSVVVVEERRSAGGKRGSPAGGRRVVRRVRYRVVARPGERGVQVSVNARVTLPASLAKRWMGEGVEEVEVEQLEDGSLLLTPKRA